MTPGATSERPRALQQVSTGSLGSPPADLGSGSTVTRRRNIMTPKVKKSVTPAADRPQMEMRETSQHLDQFPLTLVPSAPSCSSSGQHFIKFAQLELRPVRLTEYWCVS